MPDDTLPRHARAVVVGAGIVGCSVAYHLTKLGWRDIVVVDQGPLFETGGSTSHAPGLVFQINPSKTMTSFASYSVDLWSRLELDGVPCAKVVGSMEVAWTPERLDDLKRKVGLGQSWGVEAHMLGAAETRVLFPMLSERVLGAMYVPSDIQTRATRPAEAMAREAERKGAAFYGNVKVTGFGIDDGRVTTVQTARGDIETELVVSAVGIWAPRLCGLAGVPIPLSPMQHIYAVTTPLAGLAGAAEEISLPFVRHQDKSMYFRQVGEAIGIGSYRHEPLLVEAEDVPEHWRAPTGPAEMPFTPDHFQNAMAAAREVMPSVEGAGLTRKFNGLFSFTTDGFPVLGESPQVRGFWSAQAVWITHAGGVGRAVAEWIVNGEPTADIRESDIRRFHPHALSLPYVRARAAQQYREVYDIIHPRQQASSPRNIRLSPFFARQQELDAVFFENAGWERPQWYEANMGLLDSLTVHRRIARGLGGASMVANGCGRARRRPGACRPVRPHSVCEVRSDGPRRARRAPAPCLQPHGQAHRVDHVHLDAYAEWRDQVRPHDYAAWLRSAFLVVTGGAMGLHDLDWIRSHLPDDGSASVADVSSGRCCIGLWGPRARELLGSVSARTT